MRNLLNIKFSNFILFLIIINLISINTPLYAATEKPVYSKEKAPELSELQYLTFLSSYVTVDGKRHQLASKDPISLRFDEKTISVTAGCNILGGNYNLSKGLLRSQTLFQTKKSCSKKLFNQDLWLNQLFSSKPKIMVQFVLPNSKVRTPAMVLTLYTTLTPSLKVGKSVIKMKIQESYGFAETPLGDQDPKALVEATCSKLLSDSATESEAQISAEQNGLLFRVVSREGEQYAVTKDYIINRINIAIKLGKVSECFQG